MRTISRSVLVCGALVAMASFAVAEPGRNAFLQKSVTTTAQLIAQVKKNPKIMDSYRRHYAMTDEQVIAYLSTLRPVRLTEAEEFTVYSVPGNGEFKSRTDTLKKGELIFVDPSGNPVMMARCGNPLGRGPRQPEAVPNEADVNVAPPELVSMPVPDVVEYVPTLPLAMEPAPPVVPELVVEPPAPEVAVRSAPNPIGPLMLLLVPIVPKGDGGGGDNVIPEPASILALGLGAAALASRRLKKRA